MNTKKILGIIAALMLVAVALVGAGAADDGYTIPVFTVNGAGAYTVNETVMDKYDDQGYFTGYEEKLADYTWGLVRIEGLLVAGKDNAVIIEDPKLKKTDIAAYEDGNRYVVWNVGAGGDTSLDVAFFREDDVKITVITNDVPGAWSATYGSGTNITKAQFDALVQGGNAPVVYTFKNKINYYANEDLLENTVFYYEKNLKTFAGLEAGTYFSDNGSFTIPVVNADAYCITPDVPAGVYYLDNIREAEFAKYVYVKAPATSYVDVSEKILYNKYTDGKVKTVIKAENAAGLKPELAFVKDGNGAYVEKIAGILVTPNSESKWTLEVCRDAAGTTPLTTGIGEAETGTWDVYANFAVDNNMDAGALTEEYQYVKIGTIKIADSAADGVGSIELSATSVEDGSIFFVTVKGPETKGLVSPEDTQKIKLKYYTDDADKKTDITVGSGKDIEIVANQVGYNGGFVVPKAGEIKIALKANTGSLKDKAFTIVANIPGVKDSEGKYVDYEAEIAIKGSTFTAAIGKDFYYLGEDIYLSGDYSTKKDLYFYIEGTNVAFYGFNGTGKLADWKKSDKLGFDKGEDGWQAGIKGDAVVGTKTLKELNPGTYTVYVSTQPSTAGKDKIVESSKAVTLKLAKPMISIVDVDTEVELGEDAIYASVEAIGTDEIQFYVAGQNKLFAGNSDNAITNGVFKDLKSWLSSNVYKEGNVYIKVDGAWVATAVSGVKNLNDFLNKIVGYENGGNTVTHINTTNDDAGAVSVGFAKGLGYVVVECDDGIFDVYIGTKALTNEFNVSKISNEFALGTYYFVAQHPMADGVFGTGAWSSVDHKTPTDISAIVPVKYETGFDIITNNAIQFNIPSVENLAAAQKLVDAIKLGNDACAGAQVFVVAIAGNDESISGVQTSYKAGDIITITVDDSKYATAKGTLEANEFEFDAANVNYIQSFVVTSDETASNSSKYKHVMTLDTAQVPAGKYVIVLRDNNNEVVKVYETEVVGGTVGPVTPVDPVEPVEPVDPITPPAPATPGFGILAALAGLGAVAVLVLRRK